jgi:hypothetical protein
MNIFSFTAHFGTEQDCRLHFKEQRDKEGLPASGAGALLIIGYRANGFTNARDAAFGLRFASARSWRVPSCPFWSVIGSRS